jgi:hypothetical protein
MYKINKNLELNRIEIAISGDEILGMLPESLEAMMNEKLETEEEYPELGNELTKELDKFEKGVYVVYVPIDKIKITGF